MELGLLQPVHQYTINKVFEKNINICQIHQNLDIEHRGEDELGVSKSISILLKSDNQGLIALIHNPVFYSRTKHIDIQHHYIQGKMAAQKIKLSYIPTNKMIADSLIKALTHIKFHHLIEQMNM